MAQFESDRIGDTWGAVLDKLILGVSHHISNRVSTLAGVSEILAGDDTLPPIIGVLSGEVPKLEEAVRLLRLLAVSEEGEEAVEPIRLVEDAIALAKLHPDFTGVVYTTVGGSETPPVLAYPVALTHEILVALSCAASDSEDGNVLVQLGVDGSDVLIMAGSYSVSARSLVAARQTSA
jgi:hypothetical protein